MPTPATRQTTLFIPRELSEVVPDDSRFGSFAGPIPRRGNAAVVPELTVEFESFVGMSEPPEMGAYPWPMMYPGFPYPVFQVMPQGSDQDGDGNLPIGPPFFYPPGCPIHDFYPPRAVPVPTDPGESVDNA
jgi:hypothetical protein